MCFTVTTGLFLVSRGNAAIVLDLLGKVSKIV